MATATVWPWPSPVAWPLLPSLRNGANALPAECGESHAGCTRTLQSLKNCPHAPSLDGVLAPPPPPRHPQCPSPTAPARSSAQRRETHFPGNSCVSSMNKCSFKTFLRKADGNEGTSGPSAHFRFWQLWSPPSDYSLMFTASQHLLFPIRLVPLRLD